mgnify:CR=1 FL=1
MEHSTEEYLSGRIIKFVKWFQVFAIIDPRYYYLFVRVNV